VSYSLRKLKDFPAEYLHQHKTNASSKPLPPFQEGAEAEIETASTPTSKGTSPSTQEASPTRGRFLFYKYLKSLGKMRDQEIIGLWEAYQQVHAQPQEEVEVVDEARRADKEGYERGTSANPTNRNIPAGDPSQRSMLHSKLKRRADEMGRERRGSPAYRSGSRPPVSKKEKAFLTASDRTRQSVRNPPVPDTGRHAGVSRYDREDSSNPKRNPKHNANKETAAENFDLFDYLLEYLVAEGYADTNKAALAIMANMSEEWKQSIVEGVRPGDVETPLNMATYERRRRSLAGSEERDDARSRGHEEPSTGRTYSTGEARSRRRGIHTPAGKPNRDAARDAAGGETGHGGPLRPNKVRKARAMGELGEK